VRSGQSCSESPLSSFNCTDPLFFLCVAVIFTGNKESEGELRGFEDADYTANERFEIWNGRPLGGWCSWKGDVAFEAGVGPAFFGGHVDRVVAFAGVVAFGGAFPFEEGVGGVAAGREGIGIEGCEMGWEEICDSYSGGKRLRVSFCGRGGEEVVRGRGV